MAQSKRLTLSLLLLLCLVSLPARAIQAAAHQPELNPDLLEQKLSLMDRMLHSSASSRRIQTQGSEQAKQRLQQANDHFLVAAQALGAGQLRPTYDALEQAMTFYSAAAATVADATDKGEAQKTRYQELSVSVESFRLYVQKAMLQSNEPSPLDAEMLASLMQLAGELGRHQHYGQANEVLNEAYMLTITAVSALKGGTTIVYSNTFETPAQQYDYELERYKGLMQLYEMVIPDGDLPAKYRWTQKPLSHSEQSYNKAIQLAKQSDYPQALKQLDDATKKLTQVLRMLGLPIS